MKTLKAIIALTPIILIFSCTPQTRHSEYLETFQQYYKSLKNDPESRWDYTADTVKLWFDDKKSDPVVQVKGQRSTGRWKEWDEVMNSTSYYDSIWYDEEEAAVKGYFFENNDFYELIGKSPNKTLRTYWFNEKDLINEILIYWIPEENTTTTEHLKPIVEWAYQYDSAEIAELYPEGRLIPSGENALRWKDLIKRYQNFKQQE